MKFKTLIILALTLVLLVTVAVPVSAARPTQKIKYAHRSDCAVVPGGTVSLELYAPVGDRSNNQGSRMVVKFRLGGISLARMASAQLQLSIGRSRVDGTQYFKPFPNPGLGNTEVIHIADYGRTVSSAVYNASSIGNDPGVLWGADNVTDYQLPPIDVTAAVTQAKLAGYHFVTFRIQTATVTDGDSLEDAWYFCTSEQSREFRPTLIINLAQSSSSIYAEDFSESEPGDELPSGWTGGGNYTDRILVLTSSYAGGTSPELYFGWGSDNITETYSIYTPSIDATGVTSALNLSFKHFHDYWEDETPPISPPYSIAVDVSTDGGATWGSTSFAYNVTADIGPETVSVDLGAYKGHTINIRWSISGWTYWTDGWYIDDIVVAGY